MCDYRGKHCDVTVSSSTFVCASRKYLRDHRVYHEYHEYHETYVGMVNCIVTVIVPVRSRSIAKSMFLYVRVPTIFDRITTGDGDYS